MCLFVCYDLCVCVRERLHVMICVRVRERHVQQSLDQVMKRRTSIVIAHVCAFVCVCVRVL